MLMHTDHYHQDDCFAFRSSRK